IKHAPGILISSDANTFVLQSEIDNFPGLTFSAQPVLFRHKNLVEKHLVYVALTNQGRDRLHLDTWRSHVGEQDDDTCLAFLPAAGAGNPCEKKAIAGVARIRGPDFSPRYAVSALDGSRGGSERGKVGSGARLRKALTPDRLAVADRRQVF